MIDFFKKINWSGIDSATVTRLIITLIAIVNVIARMFGMNQIIIPDDNLYDLTSAIFLVISSSYAIYKNTNLTKPAQTAQGVLEDIREGTILIEDLEKVLSEIRSNKDDK